MKPSHQTALAFVVSALVGLVLRSRDCFVVDGAGRCLPVFHHHRIFFHPNNHFLYPVNVLFWTRMVAALGFPLSDPLRFVLAVDTMNCLAAAGCIAILYWILLRVTGSWKLATAICVGYGFTVAFLAQAVNPNEPMVGAFWSSLALVFAVLAAGNRRLWPVMCSGLLFAFALATYRTMVLIAPAAALLLVVPLRPEKPSRAKQALSLATLGVSFMAGCAAIFGWAYSYMRLPRAIWLAAFIQQGDSKAYFDPSATQWLKLPLGLVRNCFPVLPNYNGMRGFLRLPKPELIAAMALVFALWFCLFYCLYTVVKRWNFLASVERAAALVSATGLVFTMIPLLTWNPHYGKFWIQPLACLAVLVAIAFRHFSETSPRVLYAARALGCLFIAGVACNLSWAIRSSLHQPFEFEEAHKVMQFVGDKDFVVLDRGADSVSVMYAEMWAEDGHFFPFMDMAVAYGDDTVKRMDDAIRSTQAAGGKVFFLGLIDLPKAVWDPFLAARCGIPYQVLDRYRAAVHPTAQFKSRNGPTYLYELDSAPPQSGQRESSARPPVS